MEFKKIVCSLLLVLMSLIAAVPAFATTTQQVISLPANQVWAMAGSDNRSMAYSYVYARNHSVYPKVGIDFYSTIRCRVLSANELILNQNGYYSLEETQTTYTHIDLRQGYLEYNKVYFEFCGNTNSAANAVVSYSGN